MCLIVFAYKQHPRYQFIFAANRDEFYQRPTRKAQFWNDHPNLLAGKDLKAGGTWMGITKGGRFSALTNYRDPASRKEDAPSRGKLVLNYLKGDNPPEVYLRQLHPKADQYNGFNLLVGSIDKLMYYSNHTEQSVMLDPGLYGLSNDILDTSWPKTDRAKEGLSQIMSSEQIDESELFDILRDDQPAAETELPDTGIPRELERAISPIFIKTEKYGTRCSTILLVDQNGNVTFEEQRFENGSMEIKEKNRYEFELETDG